MHMWHMPCHADGSVSAHPVHTESQREQDHPNSLRLIPQATPQPLQVQRPQSLLYYINAAVYMYMRMSAPVHRGAVRRGAVADARLSVGLAWYSRFMFIFRGQPCYLQAAAHFTCLSAGGTYMCGA